MIMASSLYLLRGELLCIKYIEKLLQRFGFEDCKPISTPVESGFQFSIEEANDSFDTSHYKQVVECLIYACNTRLDIQYIVS
jgi:hypothetical protein